MESNFGGRLELLLARSQVRGVCDGVKVVGRCHGEDPQGDVG